MGPTSPTSSSNTNRGIIVIHQDVDSLGEGVTLLTEGDNQFIHTQATGIGFHGLDGLELESDAVDLGLDGGVRGHLHRGNTIDWERVTVKLFSQFFLFFFGVLAWGTMACGDYVSVNADKLK